MHLDFLKDSVTFFIFRVIVSIGWLVSLLVITRVLNPEAYGRFVLLNTMVLFGATATTSWINASVMRFNPEYELNSSGVFFRTNVLKLALQSLVCFSFLVLVVILFNLFHIISVQLQLLTLVWFFLQSLCLVMLTFYRASRKVTLYGLFNTWQVLGGLILGIAFLHFLGGDLPTLLTGFIVSFALLLPILYKEVSRKEEGQDIKQGKFTKGERSEFFRFGLNAALINFFSQGLSNIDKLFITNYKGTRLSGIYSASYTLAEQTIFAIVSIFALASTPILYSLWTKGQRDEVKNFLRNISRYYIVIIVPILCFVFLLYKEIGSIFLQGEYASGYHIIPVVSFGAFFVGMSTLFTDILTAAKKISILMRCYLFAFLVNVLLNLLLIPSYSIMGSALATLLSYVVLFCFVVYYTRREISWELDRLGFVYPILIGFVLFFALYPLKEYLTHSGVHVWLNIGVIGGLFVVGYLTAIFYFNVIVVSELRSFGFRSKIS